MTSFNAQSMHVYSTSLNWVSISPCRILINQTFQICKATFLDKFNLFNTVQNVLSSLLARPRISCNGTKKFLRLMFQLCIRYGCSVHCKVKQMQYGYLIVTSQWCNLKHAHLGIRVILYMHIMTVVYLQFSVHVLYFYTDILCFILFIFQSRFV